MALLLHQIPTYQVDHFKSNAKSKIDQRDPNPAHQLKHTVEELTLSEGTTINPRFSTPNRRSRAPYKRGMSIDTYPTSRQPISHIGRRDRLNKSQSLDSTTPSRKIQPIGENVVLESVSESPAKNLNKSVGTMEFQTRRYNSLVNDRLIRTGTGHPPSIANRSTFDVILEDSSVISPAAPVEPEQSKLESQTKTNPFEDDVVEDSRGDTSSEPRPTTSETSDHEIEFEMEPSTATNPGIYDFEVTNTSTETTVVLKHLLALRGGSDSSSKQSSQPSSSLTDPGHHNTTDSNNTTLNTIDEDAESEDSDTYYESEPDSPKAPIPSAILAHPIPRLIISDEDGTLVEIIHKGDSSHNQLINTPTNAGAQLKDSQSVVSVKTVHAVSVSRYTVLDNTSSHPHPLAISSRVNTVQPSLHESTGDSSAASKFDVVEDIETMVQMELENEMIANGSYPVTRL